ncbi:hypothetical protein HD599_001200 [Conyzicola lurida]|uniref:Helicase HerA central domain-containing protein n=1 Tax=Conyzicola lurida TaxID=1172621 RepID=A0A841AI16_9MICO|nr:ATP-binding protein [Conyzicola lurida]MBB5842877.1 hypothetical protein [Conyzicola lurida]
MTQSTATSPDGRLFRFDDVLTPAVEPGAFVTLHHDGIAQLGQIDDVDHPGGAGAHGAGRLLGVVSPDGNVDTRDTRAFRAADLSDALPTTVEALQASAGATLGIGTYLSGPKTQAAIAAHRFNRHTFWCGQSGSGKTYALGVVLEQLLIHTALPMVILDPNADFVRLGDGDALAGRDIRILRPSSPDPDSLRVRFVDLPTRSKGAVLHLHPLDDRAEYNELIHLEETLGGLAPEAIVPALRSRGTQAAVDLAARIENLGLTGWPVWAGGRATANEIVESRPDATVLDLGGFANPDEHLVVAMAVLDDLWARRESRRPILIVIDEAHNLCSPEPADPLHTAVRDRIVQIAAEGRKFGLWLLLSTQRPSRVHQSIVSQCDNLALMKMTSPLDLDELASIFGFVPPSMFARSPRFRQGEALFAGGFVAAPALVAMGTRLTPEGGADVRVPVRDSHGGGQGGG